MIHNVLRTLGGIEQYGTLSLCLFSFIFLCVFVWACLLRKGHLERMSRLPLEAETETGTDTEELNRGNESHE